MLISNVTVGEEVVRTQGDYVVGRVGNVIAIDTDKGRVQVAWNRETTTWVKSLCIEPTRIPYEMKKVSKMVRGYGYEMYKLVYQTIQA
jgi:preprotein translocase subunit YajC